MPLKPDEVGRARAPRRRRSRACSREQPRMSSSGSPPAGDAPGAPTARTPPAAPHRRRTATTAGPARRTRPAPAAAGRPARPPPSRADADQVDVPAPAGAGPRGSSRAASTSATTPDRHVDEEDPAPAVGLAGEREDQPADHRPDRRRDADGGAEEAERPPRSAPRNSCWISAEFCGASDAGREALQQPGRDQQRRSSAPPRPSALNSTNARERRAGTSGAGPARHRAGRPAPAPARRSARSRRRPTAPPPGRRPGCAASTAARRTRC